MNNRKRVLPLILLTIFVDLLGYGILIPVIPLLLAAPRSPYYLLPHGWTMSQGFILLGYLSAIYPLMQFIATPILGELSDKYGRKKLLAISLGGTCISYVLFAIGILTKNIPLLFFSRALDGITGGNISVAQAALADITEPKDRAKTFGMIGAAFGLGFIIGPYIGGKLSDPGIVSWFNAATPFWFAAVLSLINTTSIILFFSETLQQKKKDLKITLTKAVTNIYRAFSMQNIRAVLLSQFFLQGGFAFFTTFFSVYLINKFGFTQGRIGDFFSYVGLWVVVAQAFILRLVTKRFKEPEILRVSLLGFAVFIYLNIVPTHSWQIFLVTPLFAIFNGLSQANMTSLVSKSADASVQGEMLGINASIQSLAMSIPPILSGYIAANLEPNAPIIVSAATIFVAWLCFVLWYKPRPVAKPEWVEKS